ncbi:hypothetical protein QA584_03525 [Anaerocolumna sp. AGMB13025]|uniref:hypothetical protein n=1 Tax=Anaerocolumna sp. AGMB13025 TaxID=3039116 RepID=UPI00241F74F3|nr:hypothetical protein [Anaerocolumna sp. AGMB13025]WFR58146.1 hypothetical protein QA584_03525 [Anaerocolumna sp. AGMB13025]
MITIEFDYVVSLCVNILENSKFANEYNKYKLNNTVNEDFEFYYNKDLVNFMVKVLQLGESFDFAEHNQLNLLFHYIHNILYLRDRNELLKKQNDYIKVALQSQQSDILKEINNYVFEDSILLKFEVDYEEKICKCFFSNVLIYGDKRSNPLNDVEVDNLMLHFMGLKDFKVKGSLNFDLLKSNSIFLCTYYKVSDNLYSFIFLCTANYEHFIFEITFSDVNAVRFEYDETNYQFNM